MPVAQIVAGFTKVFVGEIVEKGECRSLLIHHVAISPHHPHRNLIIIVLVRSSCSPGAPRREGTPVSRSPARGVPHVPGGDRARWLRSAITREKALHAISALWTSKPPSVADIASYLPELQLTCVSSTMKVSTSPRYAVSTRTKESKDPDPDSTFALRGEVLIQRLLFPAWNGGELVAHYSTDLGRSKTHVLVTVFTS